MCGSWETKGNLNYCWICECSETYNTIYQDPICLDRIAKFSGDPNHKLYSSWFIVMAIDSRVEYLTVKRTE